MDEELEDLKSLAKNLEEQNHSLLAQTRQTVGSGLKGVSSFSAPRRLNTCADCEEGRAQVAWLSPLLLVLFAPGFGAIKLTIPLMAKEPSRCPEPIPRPYTSMSCT